MVSQRRVTRSVGRVVIALAAFLIAATPVFGVTPTRTVNDQLEPLFFPAGFGCSFDMFMEPLPGSRLVSTEFADGRWMITEHADVMITNLDSGAALTHRGRFQSINSYDEATNSIDSVLTGQLSYVLFPGDEGPSGTVEDPGLFLRIVGTVETTFDLDTGLITSFAYTGTATDLCALIS